MKFTPDMEAAYTRGLELSRRQHRRPSTHVALAQSPLYGFLEETFGNTGARFSVSLSVPDELVEAYTSENEQSAFCAGWMDGGALAEMSVSARAALEREE